MTMTPDQAETAIAEVLGRIAPEVDLTVCDHRQPMTQELDLDSMDMLELLAGIVERTGIVIPETEINSDWSLSDLIAGLVARSPSDLPPDH